MIKKNKGELFYHNHFHTSMLITNKDTFKDQGLNSTKINCNIRKVYFQIGVNITFNMPTYKIKHTVFAIL